MFRKLTLTALALFTVTGLAAAQGMGGGMGGGMGMGAGNPNAPFMQRFKAVDENGDGFVSKEEMVANATNVFLAMDADQSGDITMEEYMFVKMNPDGGKNPAMQQRKADRFPVMDTDKNGRVSQAEFVARAEGDFPAADANGDGKLEPMEFRGHAN